MKQQVDLMGGLTLSTKKEFVRTFAMKIASSRKEYLEAKNTIEKELTAINRDYGIVNYHNKGFIFNWGELQSDGINWGEYRSSFNIDSPHEIITIGGNYTCDAFGPKGGIHPNIHIYKTKLTLPTVNDGKIFKICFDNYDQLPVITILSNKGLIYEVLQIARNMFDTNEAGDGLWNEFFQSCQDCNEPLPEEPNDNLCDSCRCLREED